MRHELLGEEKVYMKGRKDLAAGTAGTATPQKAGYGAILNAMRTNC